MDGQFVEFGLADALGSVRAEIAVLKAREAALRRAILAAPGCEAGREFEVLIRRKTARRFDRDALPRRVLDDPRYWKEVATTTVLTTPRSDTKAPNPHLQSVLPLERVEDDFEVIEDM